MGIIRYMKNILVAQSGGPTSAINASLSGLIEASFKNSSIDKVYGSLNGISGLINDDLIEITDTENLKTTPSAYLGSVRYHLSEHTSDVDYQNILKNVEKYNIGYIAFIGGNDSMDTVAKLSKFFSEIKYPCNVIGVPKTIDNDLVGTDHTPGYGSAVKYIATTFTELKLDTNCYRNGRVTIVEVMGRDAGWLTAGSKLASINGLGPDLIYLPESPFDVDKFLNDVQSIYNKQKKVLVAVSEGIRNHEGVYVANMFTYSEINDVFGHKQLGGVCTVLADLVKEKLDLPVRRIELNLMQRCAGHIASKTDLDEAYQCGAFAIEKVLTTNGKFVSMVRKDQDKYELGYELVEVADVANKVKEVPQEWIINGNDVSDEFIKYALPLIQGEVGLQYENGLPVYKVLK